MMRSTTSRWTATRRGSTSPTKRVRRVRPHLVSSASAAPQDSSSRKHARENPRARNEKTKRPKAARADARVTRDTPRPRPPPTPARRRPGSTVYARAQTQMSRLRDMATRGMKSAAAAAAAAATEMKSMAAGASASPSPSRGSREYSAFDAEPARPDGSPASGHRRATNVAGSPRSPARRRRVWRSGWTPAPPPPRSSLTCARTRGAGARL